MGVMNYAAARDVVHQYNKLRSAREAARVVKVEWEECLALVDWLWHRTYSREKDLDVNRASKCTLPELTENMWAEYLYANKIPPSIAAHSLAWEVSSVVHHRRQLQTLRGRKRRQICLREPDELSADLEPGDPTPEEIAARASELQKTRDAEAKTPRVEICVWTDTRQ
jgi:hypothetical protein